MRAEDVVVSGKKGECTDTLSVAVHLHVFYTDLIPEFVCCLERVPRPFTLLISVPQTVSMDDKEITASFRTLPHVQKTVVKRVPNRGRDIAPMVCSFADEIQQHDVLLHLHTKKSPHDVRQKGWLEHILEHLLPSVAGTETLLCMMQRGAGIIVPPDFLYRIIPDGWFDKRNMLIAQQLLNRAELKTDLKEEYPEIDFPQGSMFWARTDYLKHFLDLGLTYEDFPAEPIGVDGTMAHALERLFFIWGRDSGMTPYRVYLTEQERTLTHRFMDMAHDLATERMQHTAVIEKLERERSAFIKKNDKHLRWCRLLCAACVVLFVLLVTVCVVSYAL